MKKYLLHIVLCFCFVQQSHSQEDGVVSFDIPVRNSLKFNKYIINPTFSFVREQNKYISFYNKRQWVQFDDAPQTYLFSYSGRFRENVGIGVGLFQQDYGVLTTFGGVLNFAYNVTLDRNSNLTFGMNLGFYKSGINEGKVLTNFPDPSLEKIPSNSLFTVNPGINYGTTFFDFGVSLNNLVLYNIKTSELIEDNPEQSIQAHMMYTGYINSRGFFDRSKFSGLIRSEFRKTKTIVSGIMMLNIPKGIWAQTGYNSLYGLSAGLGFNISTQIALEYNYEKAIGDLSTFGNSHEITLAYKFKNKYRYNYSGDDDEVAIISLTKNKRRSATKRKTTNKAKPYKNAEERAKIKAEAKAIEDARLAEEAKAKADAEAKAEEKVRLAAEAKVKAEAETKAKEEARLATAAKVKAEAEERARLAAEAKVKAEAETKAKEEARLAAAKVKAEAEERARLAAEAKVKAEAEAKAIEEARLAAESKAKAEAEAKAEEEARLATEAKAIAYAEAKAKADEEARLVAEAKAKADAEAKAKAEAEIATIDDTASAMNNLTKLTEDSKIIQQQLLARLGEMVASREQDLEDLKEENDLSEQGIFKAPKPFKSIRAENVALESLKLEIDDVMKAQNIKISELENLYNERLKDVPNKRDLTNMYFLKTIQALKADQLQAVETNEIFVSALEEINVATDIERKRRIKRAAYDNEEDRYLKDRTALDQIKEYTPLSTVPLKSEDFDFGEEQSNIQIVKDIKNEESGYYLVIAVHSDVAKRDAFLTKAVSAGQANINFFYDVNTSKYYIYYVKFNGIEEARQALKSKGNMPYNSNMSMVKIEN